ncbi:MAG: hypothetical protein AAGI38_16035 [Bacteroidota bacterium]
MNEDLFFGDTSPYNLDAIFFVFNFGFNDYIFPVEGRYFEIAGLYPADKDDYIFDIIYNGASLGTLQIAHEFSSYDECDIDNSINPGLRFLFNEELICSECLRDSTYKIWM